MKLDIEDLQSIVNAIFDCIQRHEQKRAYELIKKKTAELQYVEFKGKADIQNQFVVSIGKLKLSRDLMEKKLQKFEPEIQSLWNILIEKIDNQINLLKRKKEIHAKKQ